MSVSELYDTSDAVALAAHVAAGDVTAEALLEECLRRIRERNPALNAVVHTDPDRAAAAIETGLPHGPLRGVPFLVKDLNVAVRGMPTTNGSRFWGDRPDDHDATIVSRFRGAGLVIVGRTNSPELGLNMSTEPVAHGATRNPADPGRSAGGSSGGAAAAVAAGIVPVAHASDGGGSIRIPASACGLVGLKPSRGRISLGPDAGEGWSGMSTVGVVSRTVRDTAVSLDVTAGWVPGDPYDAPPPAGPFLRAASVDPRPLRVAWSVDAPTGVPVDPECRTAVERTVALLAELGHTVIEGGPRWDAEALGRATATIIGAHTRATVDARAAEVGRSPTGEDLEPVTLAIWELNAGRTAAELVAAERTVHAVSRVIAPFFEDVDVLVTPTLATPPPPLGTLRTDDLGAYAEAIARFGPFTPVWNATGQPAISVPTHRTPDGLPVGVQVVGRYGDEETLLAVAGQLERAGAFR